MGTDNYPKTTTSSYNLLYSYKKPASINARQVYIYIIFDTTNEAFTEDQTTYYTVLNTVERNKSCFHRLEIKVEYEVRILQQLVGWPST